ncbi:GmrSD restriction endonuclease domain-containing protein [Bifidobacterium angulatum]|uniref:GmrSD restriction endonuclease domain-containing protein n=1 Tax=Bifidobacterium angulatum TaxID=1683 RepID=UPI0034A23EA0
MAISATEKPLSRVFMSDYRFTIPSFQRAYTWQAENILQLVCDLQDASASANTPYFLGSLILVRNGDCKYQVIDGQQRLISLSIIIAVLRELETDPVLLEELDELILEPGNKLRGITAEPRLRLRDRDAEFFRSYVQEGDLEGLFDLREGDFETRAQYNISTNARQVFDELAKLDDDDRHRFASYLVNQVTLVIVTTDDLAGAHRIFDVMNMRGVPLTASDVFKAKVIAAMSPAARNVYAARWDDIMDPIGDDSQTLKEFFTDLHLIVSHKAVCTQLLEEFRADVLMPYVREQNVISFVDELLAPYAMAWRILDHPTDSMLPAAIVRQLVLLNDYPTGDWKPVAMWALVHSIGNLAGAGVKVFTDNARNDATKSDGTGKDREPLRLHDETRLRAILSALERVTGVDALNRQSSLARRTRAASAVRYLDRGYTMPQNRGFLITDDERRSALAHLRGELQTNARMNRLLLIRANEQLAGGRITRPRSLNAMPILPDRVAKDSPFAAWPESVRDFWSARIGNLALTQANEQQLTPLQTFKERRDRMLMSASSKRFPLTEQLAHIDGCTAKTLQWRQDETIRLIAEFWNIRYDEGNTDLSVLDEQQLTHGSSSRTPNAKRVTIAQVLASGLLIAGETLVWERPRKGERWVATVTDDGRLRLEDGNEYSSPTAAARAVGGASAGLSVWKRTSDGCKLSEIWKTYRMQKR